MIRSRSRRRSKGTPTEITFRCGHRVLTYPSSKNFGMNSLWLRSERKRVCIDCATPKAESLVSGLPNLKNQRATRNRIRGILSAISDASLYAEEIEASAPEAELMLHAVIDEIRRMDVGEWLSHA